MKKPTDNLQDKLTLKTIKEPTEAKIKVKRSEFIACLYPVENPDAVKQTLALHNEKYKDASHNCYAYILGSKQEIQYFSDQGEPSGTAGKPILNVLLHYNITDVLGVVTRYFGGVKLGIRGLIDAYSEAMEAAVLQAKLVDSLALEKISIGCNYQKLDHLKKMLKPYQAELTNINFAEVVEAEIIFPKEKSAEINKLLDELVESGQIIIVEPD